MRRRLGIGAAAATTVAAIALGGISYGSGSSDIRSPRRIHVRVQDSSETFVDVGAQGLSPGDGFVFNGPLLNRAGTKRIGRGEGQCIVIDVKRDKGECTATFFFRRGEIMVSGPTSSTRKTVLAVTGGAGRYRNVRGEAKEVVISERREDFIFRLIP